MDGGNGIQWISAGEIGPRDLVDARIQLHWALQPVTAFADCALEHLPDDSQANLGWRDDFEALVGRQRPDGLSAGLRIPDMTLLVFGDDGAISEGVSLEGRTIDWAVAWLEQAVSTRTGGPPERPIRVRDYEMPQHRVAEGASFTIEDPQVFAEVAGWFANGNLALSELTSSDNGWAEVRCWPHHFDLGTLINLEPSSIGAGFSPGDHWYGEPYFYLNPYGLAEPPGNRPSLDSGGHWHIEGWFGAVLPATRILETPEDVQESAVVSFLRGAVEAARDLLTAG